MHYYLLRYMLHYINFAHIRQLSFDVILSFVTRTFAHNVTKADFLLHLTKFGQFCIIC